jgi:hypothetical protein
MISSRAPLHRLDQEPVDQLHYRRVFDLRLGGGLLLPLLHDLQVLAGRLHVAEDGIELLLVGGLVVLLDQRAERVFAGDDGEQVEPGDEFEIFEQPQVAGIGHGDGEGAALTLERQHHALGGHVRRDQLQDLRVHLEPRQVHRRHPVLAGEHLGDLQLRHQRQLDQDVAQAMLGSLLLHERLRELLARQHPIAEENFAEPVAAARCCGRHDPVVSGV